jgi:hypothetical protein
VPVQREGRPFFFRLGTGSALKRGTVAARLLDALSWAAVPARYNRFRVENVGFQSLSLRQFCFLPAAAPAPHWWGGYSYGPRAMSDILPILIWFVPFALPGLANLRKPAFVAAAAVFVLLAAGSIAIHAKGALWYSGYM